jgi:hypothetical protein
MHVYRKKFLASDFTVAINSTKVDGTDFTSEQIILGFAEEASLTFFVKGGNAGCSKDVVFKFACYDGLRNKWDTIDYLGAGAGVSVAANGTTEVQKTISFVPNVEKIKLLSVQNQETVAGYTVDVNVSIFIKA